MAEKQTRYYDLRNRLSEASYSGVFGIDSLDTVEELFNDLQASSESYRQCTERENKLSSDLTLAQSQLFPLRKENAKLSRENYQLHIDNVRIKDEGAAAVADKVMASKQMEDTLTELKLLLEFKDRQLAESDRVKSKIREAYEGIAGSALKSGPKIRSQMKVSYNLQTDIPQPPIIEIPASVEQDAEIVETLRSQMDEMTKSMKSLEDENKQLKASVEARENELTRFARDSTTADGSLNQSRLDQLIAADVANKHLIDQMNSQVDFLNEQLALREAQYSETVDKALEAERLQLEVHHKDSLLEAAESNNKILSEQMRGLESKFLNLSASLDPDTVNDYPAESSASLGDQYPITSSLENMDVSNTDYNTHSTEEEVKEKRNMNNSTSAATTSVPTTKQSFAPSVGAKKHTKTAPVSRANTSIASKGQVEADLATQRLMDQKSELSSNVTELTSRVESLQGTDNVTKQRLIRSDARIQELKEELAVISSRAEGMARVASDRQETLKTVEKERDTLQSELDKVLASTRVKDVDESNLNGRLITLQKALKDSHDEKEQINKFAAELKSDLSALRREHNGVLVKLEAEMDRAKRYEAEVSSTQNALKIARGELLDARGSATQQELALEDAITTSSRLQKRVESLEKQLEASQKDLNEKSKEIANAALDQIRKGNSPAGERFLQDQLTELRTTVVEWRTKSERLEEEKEAWLADKRSMMLEIQSASAKATVASESLNVNDSERLKLVTQINDLQDQVTIANRELNRKQLQVEKCNAELREFESTIISLRQNEDAMKTQLESQSKQQQKKDAELQSMRRNLEDQASAYREMRNLGDDSAATLMRKTERITSLEREVTIANDKMSLLQDETNRLEMALQDAQRRVDSISRQSDIRRDDLQRVTSEKESFEVKVHELKALISSMEAENRTSAQKATRLKVALQEEEDGQKALQGHNEELQEKFKEVTDRLEDTQRALYALDKERDESQNALDSAAEQIRQKDKVIEQSSIQLKQLRTLIDSSEQKLRAAAGEVRSLQNQCNVADSRIASLKEENSELLKQRSVQKTEINAAAEDLMLMTRENQALTTDLATTGAENDRLRDRISQLSQGNTGLEQAKRALEIERADLIESYRNVIRDKRKLEADMQSLGAINERSGMNSQHLQSQVSELKGQVVAMSGTETRWAKERISLGRQIETLNDQLIQAQRRIDAVDADNRRLMQDSHGLRQTNLMLNERVQMIIKRASAATEANRLLSSRLSSIEGERDAMRSVVSSERQKAADYEQIAQAARTEIALKESRVDSSGAEGSIKDEDLSGALGLK